MQQNNFSQEQANAISIIYIMQAGSFPSFQYGYNSDEFAMWKEKLANYHPDAIRWVASEIPTLRKPDGLRPKIILFALCTAD